MNLYKVGYIREWVDVSNNSNVITHCYVVAPTIMTLQERVSFTLDNDRYKTTITTIEHVTSNIII